RVQRVVKIRTVAQEVPVRTYVASPAPVTKPKATSKSHTSPVVKAPAAHTNLPQQAAPLPTSDAPTPSGTQTQSSLPTADPSGAGGVADELAVQAPLGPVAARGVEQQARAFRATGGEGAGLTFARQHRCVACRARVQAIGDQLGYVVLAALGVVAP